MCNVHLLMPCGNCNFPFEKRYLQQVLGGQKDRKANLRQSRKIVSKLCAKDPKRERMLSSITTNAES